MKYLINSLIIIAVGCFIFSTGVIYNPTESIASGFYYSYLDKAYHKGDLVMLCISSSQSVLNMQQFGLPLQDDCPQHNPYLAKQIIGIPGDYIDISSQQVVINGVVIPNSHIFTKIRGIEVYQANQTTQFYLAKDQFFVIGGSVYSYDSRYFGLVREADIYRKLKLIWHTKIYW